MGQALVQKFGSDPGRDIRGVSPSPFQPSAFWKGLESHYVHEVLDLLNSEENTVQSIKSFKPDVIINCVALVDLVKCESDIELARRMHAWLPGVMSRTAKMVGAQFFQVSTDQVFDGQKNSPYMESDKPNPLNQYGRSKLEGENLSLTNPNALVLRTNIVGFRDRKGHPTFGEWITSSIGEKKSITLFDDYVTSSMHVDDFSDIMSAMLGSKLTGLFHVASREPASKFIFGHMLSRAMHADFSQVKKGNMADSDLKPVRPRYIGLNVDKAERSLGRRFPTLEETVFKLARDFKVRIKEEKSVADIN